MLAIALHSHSPTEQVDERGSDAVTAGSSYCAAPVVLFCRHTAFFSFILSRSLSFFLTFLSPNGYHHDNYKCELLPVLDSSASVFSILI